MNLRLKHCPYNNHDLPLSEFSSTRAKYCKSCKIIRAFEMQKEMRLRSFERLKNKTKKLKKKTKQKTLAQWKKTTQRVVNKFIKDRDEKLTCISCNKPITDAGHYVPQGSSGVLRYHPDNINGQDVSCNRYKSGNLIEYRVNLVKKIGEDRVKWLEENRNQIHKYTREQLVEIRNACINNNYTKEIWEQIIGIEV